MKTPVQITFAYIDLVLDTGELIRIEYDDSTMDDVYDSIEYCMKRKDWWSTQKFELCSATFMGMRVDRVNMARVVAML